MPTLPDFDHVLCARFSSTKFPAVLEDESSLSILSTRTGITNDQTKFLATPGFAAAVSLSMVRAVLKIPQQSF